MKIQLPGRSQQMLLILTLTVMLGITIKPFCASIANLARLVYCRTSRLIGRRWLL
uniref:Uncharacterized protein n=1 Tax=Lotus japonicus TaxID=34305 RepID=I3SI71_LOTJA|nr:unknown [Lotus japonicus]